MRASELRTRLADALRSVLARFSQRENVTPLAPEQTELPRLSAMQGAEPSGPIQVFTVFYARYPTFTDSADHIDIDNIEATHVPLVEVEACNLDHVFWTMQGHVWSPNGEARPLIRQAGLHHTSLSVGDIVRDDEGVYWLCQNLGWRALNPPVDPESA